MDSTESESDRFTFQFIYCNGVVCLFQNLCTVISRCIYSNLFIIISLKLSTQSNVQLTLIHASLLSS